MALGQGRSINFVVPSALAVYPSPMGSEGAAEVERSVVGSGDAAANIRQQ
jgi:hypothetical protein